MKNIIRASALLGLFALIGVLFYFQPTAEAKTVFDNTNNLQQNLQQQIIQQTNQTSQSTNNPQQSEINQTRRIKFKRKQRNCR